MPSSRPIHVPTLADVLDTFAYHVRCIATERPAAQAPVHAQRAVKFGLSLGGYEPGCPVVHARIVIEPATDPDEAWGVWAHVWIAADHDDPSTWSCSRTSDHVRIGRACGNRSGGCDAYAALCAPVIQWVAEYWAKQPARRSA